VQCRKRNLHQVKTIKEKRLTMHQASASLAAYRSPFPDAQSSNVGRPRDIDRTCPSTKCVRRLGKAAVNVAPLHCRYEA
jgi:hypothetical protein